MNSETSEMEIGYFVLICELDIMFQVAKNRICEYFHPALGYICW